MGFMKDKLNSIGMDKIIENAERLNRYMMSIDEDLKALQSAFNQNSLVFVERLKRVEEKLDKLNGGGKE